MEHSRRSAHSKQPPNRKPRRSTCARVTEEGNQNQEDSSTYRNALKSSLHHKQQRWQMKGEEDNEPLMDWVHWAIPCDGQHLLLPDTPGKGLPSHVQTSFDACAPGWCLLRALAAFYGRGFMTAAFSKGLPLSESDFHRSSAPTGQPPNQRTGFLSCECDDHVWHCVFMEISWMEVVESFVLVREPLDFPSLTHPDELYEPIWWWSVQWIHSSLVQFELQFVCVHGNRKCPHLVLTGSLSTEKREIVWPYLPPVLKEKRRGHSGIQNGMEWNT